MEQGSIKKKIILGLLLVVVMLGVGYLAFMVSSGGLKKPSKTAKQHVPTLPKLKPGIGTVQQPKPETTLTPDPSIDPALSAVPGPGSTPVNPAAAASASPAPVTATTPSAATVPPVNAVPTPVPATGAQPSKSNPEQEAKVQALGKIYVSMGADKAADVMRTLNDDEVVKILSTMNARQTGKILALMPSKRVAALTRKMGLQENMQ